MADLDHDDLPIVVNGAGGGTCIAEPRTGHHPTRRLA